MQNYYSPENLRSYSLAYILGLAKINFHKISKKKISPHNNKYQISLEPITVWSLAH